MLVDANLLLFARHVESPFHRRAKDWLEDVLNGSVRVGLPWHSLVAFVRIATNRRAYQRPLDLDEAWQQVDDWLALESTWVPSPTDRHGEVLGGLVRRYQLHGSIVSDAHLAALAVEHGLKLASADTDFARFTELTWVNPLA